MIPDILTFKPQGNPLSIFFFQHIVLFLYVIIYLIVPFGSMMFVILISSMTPEV